MMLAAGGGLKFRRKAHKSSNPHIHSLSLSSPLFLHLSLPGEILNTVINCRSKRVKRSCREIKSDGYVGPNSADLTIVAVSVKNQAAIIVNYDDHTHIYLHSVVVVTVIYDENASAEPNILSFSLSLSVSVWSIYIDYRLSMTHQYFIEIFENFRHG